MKPREWYLNPVVGYKCEVNEDGIGLSGNEVHVIEYSAYVTSQAHLAHLREAAQRVLRVSEEVFHKNGLHCADDCHCAYCALRHAVAVTGDAK